ADRGDAARPQPAARPVVERPRDRAPEPHDPPAPRRPRRRFRLRIPFKRTILFVLVVLLLLSAADQIASMVDEQRSRLWDKAATSVRSGVGDQVDSLWNQAKDTFGGSSGGPG
ncbi:serine/threonine protein kinase, partial [Frankia sp. AiPs1]|nr:serine/threonine protein kinase [Frankia sp. AiPs1]